MMFRVLNMPVKESLLQQLSKYCLVLHRLPAWAQEGYGVPLSVAKVALQRGIRTAGTLPTWERMVEEVMRDSMEGLPTQIKNRSTPRPDWDPNPRLREAGLGP